MKHIYSFNTRNNHTVLIHILICLALTIQGLAAEGNWIKIGDLHNFYQDYGSEPEEGFGTEQQFGFRWNALYNSQDMQAAKGFWIGVRNFQDPVVNTFFPYKVAHVGPRPRPTIEQDEFMPVQFELHGRTSPPNVYVNGIPSSIVSQDELLHPDLNPNLPAERMMYNKVNSSTGITMERRIYGMSQQNYDDFIITEYVFTNTGICNRDGSIIHSQTLEDTYFHWQYRNAIALEGTVEGSFIDWRGRRGWGIPQNCRWGMNTMNDVIGENPDNPVTDSPYAEMNEMGIDEFDDNGNIIRAYYSWHGRHSNLSYDNIGSPNYQGWLADGMLGASQFAGAVVLHADTSPDNPDDDIYQPSTTQMIESNDQATVNNDQYSSSRMETEYLSFMSAGHPELSHAEQVRSENMFPDQYSAAGGYSQSWAFGPYTLAPGDSIRIVIAEAAGGLSRRMNFEVGNNWYRAFALGETLTLTKPDGSTTTDPDEYKSAWVYSGRDSLMQSFRRAISAWDAGLENIPESPPAPDVFQIFTGLHEILLSWNTNAENYAHFSGYRIYRAEDNYERFYDRVFECGPGTDHPEIVNEWIDTSVSDSVGYYYYIVSTDDGSVNEAEPGAVLESGKYWTLPSMPVMSSNSRVVNDDLYVSPTGSDANNGLTPEEPLKTITRASELMISSPLQINTIHLAPGVYSPSGTGETFPLSLKNFFVLKGDPTNPAVLDAEETASVFVLSNLAEVQLENLVITNGQAELTGGGINASSSTGTLKNLTIENNTAPGVGGGIYCATGSDLELINVTLRYNYGFSGGGYFCQSNAQLTLSSENRCNIYLNQANYIANDVYQAGSDVTYLTVDTFSVLSPSDYYVSGSQIEADILNAKLSQINADLFVSPTGDDGNSGLNEGQAFRTIEKAIKTIYADLDNQHIIHLAEGTYSPGTNGEQFPIFTRSYVSLHGVSRESTILDAMGSAGVIEIRRDSLVELKNLRLTGAMGTSGGAINCSDNGNIQLTDIDIIGNTAARGGGLYCRSNDNLLLAGVNIHHNVATSWGGGVYIIDSEINFDPTNRCNIYLNQAPELGYDLYSINLLQNFQIHVVLDTFTVLYPVEEFVSPLRNFTFDIQNRVIPQAEADLYVSPTGSDENNGLTPESPLKTIRYANELIFADEAHPHTIYLLEGVYSTTSNGESLPIQMRSYVSLTGDLEGGSIIDAEHGGRVIDCEGVEGSSISHITVRNGYADSGGGIFIVDVDDIQLSNLVLQNNEVDNYGAGIYASNSTVTIHNSTFKHNRGKYGAGLATLNTDLDLALSLFYDDSSRFGSALYLKSSDAILDQLTIADNPVGVRGGAITLWESGQARLSNSISWNNDDAALYLRPGTSMEVLYSNVEGGLEAVYGDSIDWLDGNLDQDPLFCHVSQGVYAIAENSPCIGSGMSGVTMGALGIGCTVAIDDDVVLPIEHSLSQNYPNPFNPVTTIRYGVGERENVHLVIYDITGRTVLELQQGEQPPGWYEIHWQGFDRTGRPMSTGLYFCTLQAGDYRKTIKMLYLK